MMRARSPKLADFIIDSEADVLAYMTFPSQHRTKLHSKNLLERLNKEVKRRARCRRHLPQRGLDRAAHRCAVLLGANDDWQLQHRYMQIEGRPN
jgi:putative transposase